MSNTLEKLEHISQTNQMIAALIKQRLDDYNDKFGGTVDADEIEMTQIKASEVVEDAYYMEVKRLKQMSLIEGVGEYAANAREHSTYRPVNGRA